MVWARYIRATATVRKSATCVVPRVWMVHDGYDRRKQAVKIADVFEIEKVWATVYETSRQHGDLPQKRVTQSVRIF